MNAYDRAPLQVRERAPSDAEDAAAQLIISSIEGDAGNLDKETYFRVFRNESLLFLNSFFRYGSTSTDGDYGTVLYEYRYECEYRIGIHQQFGTGTEYDSHWPFGTLDFVIGASDSHQVRTDTVLIPYLVP